jgi:hypothetical protein
MNRLELWKNNREANRKGNREGVSLRGYPGYPGRGIPGQAIHQGIWHFLAGRSGLYI